VALSFGMKDIAASIIAGVALIMDMPFQVGDRITFEDFHGDVISIGLHSVKIITLDESIVTIPNQNFMSGIVVSNSAGEFGMVTTVDINLKPTSNLDKAKTILNKIATDSPYIDTRKVITIVVKERFTEGGVLIFVVKIKSILKDARTEKAFQTDFLMAANKALMEKKIR
jgi:small-conductance mechanosensitive channel